MKKILLTVTLLLLVIVTFGQNNPICQSDYISIENEDNVPTTITNADGTLTLTFPQQSITDLFESYVIFGFEQAFPGSGNPVLENAYILEFNSKDLLFDIQNEVDPSIINVDNEYTPEATVPQDLIQYVDGKIFKVIGSRYLDEQVVHLCDIIPNSCDAYPVPSGFLFTLSFDYDVINDLLVIETIDSTCDQSFSITMKRTNFSPDAKYLQLWTINNFNAVETMPNCEPTTFTILEVFQLHCGLSTGFHTYYEIDDDLNILRLFNDTPIFGTNVIELRDVTLDISENNLEEILVFEPKDSPYLHVVNPSNKELSMTIFDITGKEVFNENSLKHNSVSIESLQSGTLYLLNITSTEGENNVFKLLKR